MKTILNFKKTSHFEEQARKRHIDEFLISLCIAKGETQRITNDKSRITLRKEKIIEAAKYGYISLADYKGLMKIVIIARNKFLITVFARYGDTGILYN